MHASFHRHAATPDARSRPARDPAQAFAPAQPAAVHDFAGRRWVSIAMRTLHIVGVVMTAVAIFGQQGNAGPGAALMLASGAALFAVDLWHHRVLWRELAGLFVGVKLALLVVMIAVPALAAFLFWLLVVTSCIVSHAPRRFRHLPLLP